VRKILLLFSIVFAVVPVGLFLFLVFNRHVSFSELRNLAESKIGTLLQATVKVGEINIGFLDRVSLKGLKISQEPGSKLFYLFDVDRIVFRYRWSQFWKSQFDIPKVVMLDSPKFVFRSAVLPEALLTLARTLAEGAVFVDELTFRHGRMRFDLPNFRARFDLSNLRGNIHRGKGKIWKLEGASDVNQFFRGKIRAEGIADLETNQSSVRFYLEKLDSTHPNLLPLANLRGVIEFSGDEVRIERIAFSYKHIPVMIKGRVSLLSSAQPKLELEVSMGRASYRSVFAIKGALTNSDVKGNIQLGARGIPVEGRLGLKGSELSFEDFRFGGFFATGAVNTRTGDTHLYLERDKERIDLKFNFKNWSIRMRLAGDHLPFFGLDLVVLADFDIEPDEAFWTDEKWTFRGKMKTDYLILDQTPFPDFQGTFHTISTKLDRMQFEWSKGFRLEGSASLESPYVGDCTVMMEGILLEKLKSFFFKPLPSGLRGDLSGRIHIRGEARNPEVEGNITVANGAIKGLDYEELWMHFYGVPPYLKIKESRLKKGMRTFYLDGGIDLAKQNIFQDLTAASSEKIIIWTGTELTHNEPRAVDQVSGKEDEKKEAYAIGPRIKF